MTHHARVGRLALAVAALMVVLAVRATAQDPRNRLRLGIDAYDLAEYVIARAHLTDGLVPTSVPRDQMWSDGLFRLTHVLIETKQDSLAALWLRWGLRQNLDIAIDTLAFPPTVLEAYTVARSKVAEAAAGLRDVDTETQWSWNDPRSDTLGAIRLDVAAGVPLALFVEGVGSLRAAELRRLPAGSYTILAAAPGFFRTRLTREVLPGATSVIRFQLRRTASQARGFLYVSAKPWGEIWLDNRLIGYTPMSDVPVDAGAHRLRIERSGYVAYETSITVERDRPLRLGTIQLSPAGGPQ